MSKRKVLKFIVKMLTRSYDIDKSLYGGFVKQK